MSAALNSRQLRSVFVLVVLLLAARMTEPTTNLAFVVLAGACFRGPRALILSLAGSWFLVLANPGIFPAVPSATMLRYLVYFSAAASLVVASRGRTIGRSGKSIAAIVALLTVLIAVHGFAVSPMASLSLMKALSWAIVFISLLVAWFRLAPGEAEQVREYLFFASVLLLGLSIPLYFDSAGFFVNGTGFQGLLNHPQPFGIFAGAIAVWSSLRGLRGEPPQSLHLIIAVISLTMVIASETRTALLSVAIALGFSVIPALLFAPKWLSVEGERPHRVALFAAFFIPITLAAFLLPSTQEFLGEFLSKSGRVAGVEGISALYERSRGGLIQPMLANITTYPWTGIGFGLPSDLFSLVIKYDPYLGIPLSASIEKGNMFLAVVEELGWPLASAVFAILLMLVNRARLNGLIPMALCLFCFAVNLGENIFFSPGGMGMAILIIMSGAIAWTGQRT